MKNFLPITQKRHPSEMGKDEVEAFLTHLAVDKDVAASTQNQALSALLFLYRDVLNQPLDWVNVLWAKKPTRLPVVLTRQEVHAVLNQLTGLPHLVVQLLYGAGLRVNECLRLRVKDVDFGQQLIIVRDGKGLKDRATPLPQTAVPALHTQLQTAQKLHYQDLEAGNGRVSLPNALAQKHPKSSSHHPAISSLHIPSTVKPGSNAAYHPPGWVRALVCPLPIVPDGTRGIRLK